MILTTLLISAAALPAAEQHTLEQQVSSLWNSLSNTPQSKPDITALQQLFAKDAIVAGMHHKNDTPELNLQPATRFIASQDRIKPYGFYECEIAREVRVSGGFATVLSLVESRREATQPEADFTGINSMQWTNTGDGWQLLSLYYYLPVAGQTQTILQGSPGKCLNSPINTAN